MTTGLISVTPLYNLRMAALIMIPANQIPSMLDGRRHCQKSPRNRQNDKGIICCNVAGPIGSNLCSIKHIFV